MGGLSDCVLHCGSESCEVIRDDDFLKDQIIRTSDPLFTRDGRDHPVLLGQEYKNRVGPLSLFFKGYLIDPC
jgi:hypothetical protein